MNNRGKQVVDVGATDQVLQKLASISLSFDEATPISGLLGDGEGSSDTQNFALLAKLISVRPFNLMAMCRFMERLWRPLRMINKKIGRAIGQTWGECLEVEVEGAGQSRGSMLRVRVEVDISKPLRRGVMMEVLSNGTAQWFQAKYEKLQNFCYLCGRLGHGMDDCELELPEEDSQLPYGEWLRAASIKSAPPIVKLSTPSSTGEVSSKDHTLLKRQEDPTEHIPTVNSANPAGAKKRSINSMEIDEEV